MKKVLLLLAIIFPSVLLVAQEKMELEATLESITYKSTKVLALEQISIHHPDFKLVTDNIQILDSISLIIDGKTKKVAYELIQLVSEKRQALLQFIYVNDWLYGKNTSYYFEQGKAKEAEEFYQVVNEAILTNNRAKALMSPGGDEVYFVDEQIAAGKLRKYPAKRVQFDVWEGTSGIVLNIPDITKLENVHQAKGIWVFLSVYNTFEVPISTKFKFPMVNPPYTTIADLVAATRK